MRSSRPRHEKAAQFSPLETSSTCVPSRPWTSKRFARINVALPGAKIEFVRMERAGKSLARLKISDAISTEELARAAWPTAVGKRIASHATAKSLVRDSLIVEVDDAIWQKNLFHLRFQILAKLSDVLGSGIIRDVEFRI